MKKLRFNSKFWIVDQKIKQAHPFPGKTPTRWFIVIDEYVHGSAKQAKTIFRYRGKPNDCIRKKVEQIAVRVRGQIWMYEFDKGGTFRNCVRNLPRADFGLTSVHTILTNFYYYSTPASPFFIDPELYPKFGVIKSKAWFFFSPCQHLNTPDKHDALRNYRRWIAESKVMQDFKKGRRVAFPNHVEHIVFDAIPKPPAPKIFSIACPACGRIYTKSESHRGLIVMCPTCHYNVVAQ